VFSIRLSWKVTNKILSIDNDFTLPWLGRPHHLLWRSIEVQVAKSGLPMLVLDRSIGFYLHTVYTYGLVLFSMWIVIRMLKRESSTLTYWQVIPLVAGIFAPIGVNLLHLMPFNPLPINMTPFALITMGVVVGWFAFRFELWDIIPAAHDAIFEHMHDGVVIISPKNMVIDMNPAAARLIGFGKERGGNLPIDTVLAQWSTVIGLQQLLQERGPIAPTAFEVAVTEPTARHLELIVSDLRDRRQRLNGRLLTIRDITRRFEMEQALAEERTLLAQRVAERTADLSEANAQLARASRLKDEFMASMSHEIRTPLNAIIGFAEVMTEERFGPVGSERYKDYLKDILASGRHVLSLVNDLLDLSKIEAGKMDLAFAAVDANAVIGECVSIMQPQANHSRIVMRQALAPVLPPIRADIRALRQILLNLLSNAIKFTPAGGQVIVSSTLSDAGYVLIRVKDTGVGMTEEEVRLALEPFTQIAPVSDMRGTGLGLPLTKALVEASHASFTIRSRRQEGTLVEIAFPLPEVRAAE